MTPNCLGNFNYKSSSTGGKVFRIAGYMLVGLLFAAAFAIVFAILVKLTCIQGQDNRLKAWMPILLV